MTQPIILFPSDYFDAKVIEPDYKEEYLAAEIQAKTSIFSYSDWLEDRKVKLDEKFSHPQSCIYRGWMMSVQEYEVFYNELKKKNLYLQTSPVQYQLCHHFPNIYPQLANDTAKTLVFPYGAYPKISEVVEHFERFILKDDIKSLKDSRFPKYFSADMTEKEWQFYLKEFVAFRGNLFTGRFCLKEYLTLRRYSDTTNEWRAFFYKGKLLSLGANSQQDLTCPCPPEELVHKYSNLDSTFYTIDFGELADGKWMILETGDGQVSALPDRESVAHFYHNLFTE